MDKIETEHHITNRSTLEYIYSRMRTSLPFGPLPLWQVNELSRLRKRIESYKPERGDRRTRHKNKPVKPKVFANKLTDNDIGIGKTYVVKFGGWVGNGVVLNKTATFIDGKQNRRCIVKYSVQTSKQLIQLTIRNFVTLAK